MKLRNGLIISLLVISQVSGAQAPSYPRNYFRHPLNIRMELVANFGEIRTNHWHMGLDIRTQQKVNLPVYASADGYVSRVSVEPGGFGQAIYISHPNGFTTLYAHLNAFYPALASYVKEQQYQQESWRVNLLLPPDRFPLKKGDFIARSGSTGGSQGPHVHFEIRDSETENCLNPLLFSFPIADAVPPTLTRLAMYDRNRSTYEQEPQMLTLKKNGSYYTTGTGLLRVGTDRISFAIGATDRFNATPNPNGVFSAALELDGERLTGFVHDDISYDDSRYINAQLDHPFQVRRKISLQHLSPLPGAREIAYNFSNEDGVIHLKDTEAHEVQITIRDANNNATRIRFKIQYDPALGNNISEVEGERFLPNNLNIFEREGFELFTTEKTIYDTVNIDYKSEVKQVEGSVSASHTFLSNAIPVHDWVNVRIRADRELTEEEKASLVIRNVSGSRITVAKAVWQNGWISARFRQFGSYQAFSDLEPPVVNAPPTDLSKSSRIVFTPKDNFNSIRSLRVELNGKWLRFSNDKGRSWLYYFDEHFPRGTHDLKVIIEDEAGNVLEKQWKIRR